MKTMLKLNLSAAVATVLLTAFSVIGFTITQNPLPEPAENTDHCLSPYFLIRGEKPEKSVMPLLSTTADVQIAGVIADVRVTQKYQNTGSTPIEAVYVFPASTRAAVYAMKMTLGERVIEAKIAPRDQARRTYEQARNQGQNAALLEQQRPNVFSMNVANIMPGDAIEVELRYTELLIPTEGVYEFVYPTVVGPRYSSGQRGNENNSPTWVGNPYTQQGQPPAYSFGLNCQLAAGMPIQDIRCTSHKTNIQFTGKDQANISLKPGENQGGNRDFILRYRLSDNKINTGLILQSSGDEQFFLAMIQPPQRPTLDMIPPREYVFIVDVSGSMHGYPLDISKQLMRRLIGSLRPTDKFNVILFAGTSNLFSETSVSANAPNLKKAIDFIDKEQGSGGTELLPALQKALSLKGVERYARTFIIATDGYVTVEREAFELINKNLNEANFFAFGIGTAVNRELIEGMAHCGKGEPAIISQPEEAEAASDKFMSEVNTPVLTHIKVGFEGLDAYDVEPLSTPDVFASRPVLVFGKYRNNPQGSIHLSGIHGNGHFETDLRVNEASRMSPGNALRNLWARESIRNLTDFASLGADEQVSHNIESLGIKYNLLTEFTSFVAVDNQVRNAGGNLTTIEQPLPLPEGVSDYAIGGQTRSCGNLALPMQKSVQADSDGTLEVKEEAPVQLSAQMPEFPGGETALKEFIALHLKYPVQAIRKGVMGKVIVSFTVEKDGSISNLVVLRGIGEGCDEAAIEVVRLTSGNWIPAYQGSIPVRRQVTVPVEFNRVQ